MQRRPQGRSVTMPLHALELLPDQSGQHAIRSDWRVLSEAGLRSQQDHRGATNAPHLTLVAAVAIGAQVEALAVELIAPLLPIRVRCSGILLLGARRLTVARAVDLEDHVVATVLRLRAAVAGPQHPGWLPHLTLARGLPRADIQKAIEALGHDDIELSMTELRRWDPGSRTVTSLATSPDDPRHPYTG
jgi:hypothetical protein